MRVWCVTPCDLKLRLRMYRGSELSRTRKDPSGFPFSFISASSQFMGPQYQPHCRERHQGKVILLQKHSTFVFYLYFTLAPNSCPNKTRFLCNLGLGSSGTDSLMIVDALIQDGGSRVNSAARQSSKTLCQLHTGIHQRQDGSVTRL